MSDTDDPDDWPSERFYHFICTRCRHAGPPRTSRGAARLDAKDHAAQSSHIDESTIYTYRARTKNGQTPHPHDQPDTQEMIDTVTDAEEGSA